MKFNYIKFRNFLSYGNIFHEFDLKNHKRNLIIGKNGYGKSTIIEALVFALYGKPYRKVSKGQLVNSITKKDLVVEVEFSTYASTYKIIRGIKPNIFEVYQDGKLLDQNSKSLDYQKYLESNVLKRSYKTFTQIDILGSAKYTAFMELTAPQRREVLEDLLDLNIFSNMNVIAKEKLADVNMQIANQDMSLTIIGNKLSTALSTSTQLKTVYEKQLQDKNNSKEEYTVKAQELITMREPLITQRDTIKKPDTLLPEIKTMNSFKDSINQLKWDNEAIEREINFLNNNDSCPTCKQLIADLFRNQSLEDKQKLIEDNLNKIADLNIELVKAEKVITDAQVIINEYDNLNTRITNINNQGQQYALQIRHIKGEIIEIEKSISQFNESTTTDIDNIKLDQQLQEKHMNDLKVLRSSYLIILNSLKDTGIKSKIISQYIPVLNQRINYYLGKMNFMVSFELSETFDETIKSRFRDTFTYGSFSEGEKFRINLAILFAFRDLAKLKNSIPSNILFMDEIMDSSMDGEGIDDLLMLIDEVTKDSNAFIISHRADNIVDKFDKVYKINKNKNFSYISEED